MTTSTSRVTSAPVGRGTPRVRRSGATWAIVGLVGLLGVVGLIMANQPDTDYVPMSLHNPDPHGAMAVGHIAADHGVNVRQIRALKDARIFDPNHTTLVLASTPFLTDQQRDSIASYPGDVVVLDDGWSLSSLFGADVWVGDGTAGVRDASCDNPDAVAAGTISSTGPVYVGDFPEEAQTCFLQDDNATIVTWDRSSRQTVTLVADPAIATNAELAKEGNAAIVLRLIGRHQNLVWYVSDGFDDSRLSWSDGSDPDAGTVGKPGLDLFPPGTGTALYSLGLAVAVMAWWRARRFGPVVVEPLPIVIRASEATRGRARLYRRARATGRAAASLRALAAQRMAARLGLTRAASKAELVAAIVAATGTPVARVEDVLYGPPPRTEADLTAVIQAVDTLEGEVHRS